MPVSAVRVPNIVCAYCWKMSSYTTAYIHEHLRSNADVISCPAVCHQPPLQALIGLHWCLCRRASWHQSTRWYVTGCSGRTSSSSSTRSLSAFMSDSSTAAPLWSKLTSLASKDTCDMNEWSAAGKVQGTWYKSSREWMVQGTNVTRKRIVLITNVPAFPDIMPVPLPGSCWENHEEMLSKVLPGRSY